MYAFIKKEDKRKLRTHILDNFKLHRNDEAFLRWINVFTYKIVPLINSKLSVEVNEKLLENERLHLDWFKFFLTTKTDETLNLSFPIIDNNLYHFNSKELSNYSFDIIVRNIPVFIWMDLEKYPITLVLHLAKGNSIRTFGEIIPMSRRMAHLFQNLKYEDCNPEDYYTCCLIKLMKGSKAFFEMVAPYIRLTNNLEWSKNVLAKYDPFLKKIIAMECC